MATTIDEMLNTTQGQAQAGWDAADGFWPPNGEYTSLLSKPRWGSFQDKETGEPVGTISIPHTIQDGPEAGKQFEWFATTGPGKNGKNPRIGAVKKLAKLLNGGREFKNAVEAYRFLDGACEGTAVMHKCSKSAPTERGDGFPNIEYVRKLG